MGADDGNKDASVGSELLWTVKRSAILFRYWTTPMSSVLRIPEESEEDRVSARVFALLIIVALIFAIRGDEPSSTGKVSFTAIAAGIGAILSLALNIASKYWNVNIRDQILISAYGSTIWVMLLFLFFQTFFFDWSWYGAMSETFGPVLTPSIVAVVVTYLLLVAKAKFIDHHRIGGIAAIHGAAITVGSGLIVVIICYIGKDLFQWLVHRVTI